MTLTAESPPAWLDAVHRVALLTPREREVFLLLAEAPSNQEIADRLIVTERTVRAHLAVVLSKLHVRGRMQACLASLAFRTPELQTLSDPTRPRS